MCVMVYDHPELLRKSAENTLMDMVQLLFTRLPQFKEDPKWNANMRKVRYCLGLVHYLCGDCAEDRSTVSWMWVQSFGLFSKMCAWVGLFRLQPKAIEVALRHILSVNSHLSGFKL